MQKPFTIFNWFIFMPVEINGKETFAQLDTGAQKCRVTKAFSQYLDPIGEMQVGGVHGRQTVRQVSIQDLTFLDKTFSALEATVIEREDIYGELPFDVDCVLSGDIILAEPVLFDFRLQTLGKAQASSLTQPAFQPFDSSSGLPFLELRGRRVFNAVFDLGAGNTVVNTNCLAEFPAKKLFELPVHDTLNDEQMLDFYDVGDVSFGDYTLNVEAISADLSGISDAVGRQVDFILGVNTMMQGRWFVDKAQGEIGFTIH